MYRIIEYFNRQFRVSDACINYLLHHKPLLYFLLGRKSITAMVTGSIGTILLLEQRGKHIVH